MQLKESLAQTPADQFRRILSTYGLEAGDRSSLEGEIAARLLSRDQLQEALGRLSDEEWSALKVVYFNGGDQGVTVELCHQIVGLLSGKRRKSSARALEELQHRGLIYLRSQNYRQVFFIPTDLMQAMDEILNRQMIARLSLGGTPVRPVPQQRSLLEEVHRFLAYVHTHEITLTQQGQIFKRYLRALLDLLMPGSEEEESVAGRYPEPLGMLVGYCLDRRLIAREEGRLRTTDDLPSWVEQRDGAKRLDLFRYWQDRYFYQDLQTFLSVIRSVGDEWVSVDRLVDELEPLINPSQRGSFLLRLRHHLTTFLAPMGLFDLGEAPGEHKQSPDLTCRLTRAGGAILSGQEPAEEAPPEGLAPLLLQATFEVIVHRPVVSQVLWKLELTADLVGQTDRTLTYRLSKPSVYRALKAGMTGSELLDFLRRQSATGVPQNVAFDLGAWSRAYGQVYLQEVMLLRCADPVLAQQVKASRRTARYVIGELTPTDLIVDGQHYRELLEALEADGLMPKPEVDRPAVSAREPEES
ncbi:MAG: helicase-associated domain-containing protein [Bacillota bacterium]